MKPPSGQKKQTQFKPNLETTPGAGRAKYNNDLTVHASEPGVVTPCHVAAGIGTRPAFMPDGQTPRCGYNNFVASVPTIMFPDKGAAGK